MTTVGLDNSMSEKKKKKKKKNAYADSTLDQSAMDEDAEGASQAKKSKKEECCLMNVFLYLGNSSQSFIISNEICFYPHSGTE